MSEWKVTSATFDSESFEVTFERHDGVGRHTIRRPHDCWFESQWLQHRLDEERKINAYLNARLTEMYGRLCKQEQTNPAQQGE